MKQKPRANAAAYDAIRGRIGGNRIGWYVPDGTLYAFFSQKLLLEPFVSRAATKVTCLEG